MSRRYGTKGCLVAGCEKKHRRNGYCLMHGHRVWRHGDPAIVKKRDYGYTSDGERKAAVKRSQRVYDQTPKGKAAHVLKRHRRRHLEGGDVTLTVDVVLEIMTKFNRQCFKCAAKDDLTLDHHVPLAKGGKLEPANAVVLCRKCNGRKADKMPEEFYSTDDCIKILKLLV